MSDTVTIDGKTYFEESYIQLANGNTARAKRRIEILERALLIKAKRDQLPGDVITPEKRVKRWIKDAQDSLEPVKAEECGG